MCRCTMYRVMTEGSGLIHKPIFIGQAFLVTKFRWKDTYPVILLARLT